MAKRLSREAQRKRDHMMACESLCGVLETHIALRHRVSRHTVQRALRRAREEAPSLSELDAIEEVERYISRQYAAIEELAEMRIPGTPPEVRIRAIRTQLRILKDIWELKRAMGLLPDFGSYPSRLHFAREFWAWIRLRLEKELGWGHEGVEFLHFLIEDWLENGNKADPPPLDLEGWDIAEPDA
jgi:hypothetical protein